MKSSTTMGPAEKCNIYMQRKESPTDLRKGGDQNACLICMRGGKLLCVPFSIGLHVLASVLSSI